MSLLGPDDYDELEYDDRFILGLTRALEYDEEASIATVEI